ncbi:Protein-export membrane protein SecF [uncultured Desulfobacterium sp.]|uniref:Protein-export membrane protein SecF n=1 Tax=uncultured Desulfobacterium sp. TaxID=201089 RepID=A0A445MV13_9BACT|nr:Protein-export membrane protein SecF [uncultured Desulfobacterium sp.]
MEIIRPGTNIDFIGKRYIAYVLSGLILGVTIVMLIWRGPNFGVDFTGGVLVQVKLDQKRTPDEIRKALQPVQLEDSIIQEFSEGGQEEYLIHTTKTDIELQGLHDKLEQSLMLEFGKNVEIRRIEMVGPKVGKDLRQKALFAIYYTLLLLAIYISGRFEAKWLMSIIMAGALVLVVVIASGFNVSVIWLIVIAMIVTLGLCCVLKLKYAFGAIIALLHDVMVTVGAFVITDREFSLSVVAAILTIIGFSLNDTIVIYDRIRENIRRLRKKSFSEIINISVNETLSRTILTSGTVFFVLVALYFLGGKVINDFAFAMLVGVISGTYSTVYVASPIILVLEDTPVKDSRDRA